MLTSDHEEPSSGRSEPAVDSDMLDLVARFEKNFAELAPAREDVRITALEENLFPEFSEQPSQAPPRRGRPGALEPAKFDPRTPRPASDDQFDIDEAFSILEAAETEGAAKARDNEREARTGAAERPLPDSDVEPQLRGHSGQSAVAPFAEIARKHWASWSHRPRAIAIIGGVLVFALGLTGGYIAGRAPWGKSPAFIEVTQQGGTVLRLDTNLAGAE